MKEIWKDIVGYEDWYEISNLGRVKSVDNRKILKTCISNKGYERISITKNGKSKTFNIHRLVATAFVDNPFNKPQINHMDGNKLNNKAENLEWCTGSENVKHAFEYNLRSNKKGIENKLSKPVIQYDKNHNFICMYGSIMEAERNTNIKNQSIIQNLKGRNKTAGGFIWEYAEKGGVQNETI